MPSIVLARKAFGLGVLFSALVAGAAVGNCDGEATLRDELLSCSLSREPDCKGILQERAGNGTLPALQQLASTILEEWSLSAEDEKFARPRLVWVPTPSKAELSRVLPEKVDAVVAVLTGTVERNGRLSNVRLLRETKYPELNSVLVKAFKEALYRPAKDGTEFVDKKVNYTYRFHP